MRRRSVYRPLIGFDKEDVIRIARDIGTFDVSIAPASGCGAVPARPCTAAAIETVRALEEAVGDVGDVGMLSIQVCE